MHAQTTQTLPTKLGKVIGVIGFTIAAISLICLTEPSLRESANGYLIIGVGLLVLSGAILAAPMIVHGVVDIVRSVRSRKS